MGKKRFNGIDHSKVFSLRRSGLCQREICQIMGYSNSMVQRILNKQRLSDEEILKDKIGKSKKIKMAF